jgi:multidrug resistance efflux pump
MRKWLSLFVVGVSLACISIFPAAPDAVAGGPASDQEPSVVKVASAVEGIVIKATVKPGDVVKSGDVLLKLDDSLALADVAKAKAQVKAATQQFEAAEKAAQAAKLAWSLAKQDSSESAGNPGPADIKRLLYEKYAHEAGARFEAVIAAKAELLRTEILLAKCQVKAPAEGQVLKVHKHKGEGVQEMQAVVELLLLPGLKSPGGGASKSSIAHVSSPLRGIVAKVLVKKGDLVHKGDALMRLGDKLALVALDEAKVQVGAAEAELLRAQTAAAQAKKEWQRVKELVSINVASQGVCDAKKATWEEHAADVEAQRQAVTLAKLGVLKAELIVNQHHIVAPADGIILNIHKNVGQAAEGCETVVDMIVVEKMP